MTQGTGSVVCFGEALIDMFASAPAVPGTPPAFVPHAGGAPANVAVAVARLGGDAQFVGMLGADLFGDFLLRSLREAGVGTDAVLRTHAAKTALAFVAHDANGERSFSFYRPPAADLLYREAHFPAALFARAQVLHVCSNSMTEPEIARTTFAAMRRARAEGALVSFDLNLRPMLWPEAVDPSPWLWEGLASADLVKLSREELDYLAAGLDTDPDAVVVRLLAGSTRLLVITDGGGPILWHARTAAGRLPPFRVDVQDTTAAGDAFVAGLLYSLAAMPRGGEMLDALVRDRPGLEQALRFAAAVGALAVTRKGAFSAMPALHEVDALLKEQA